MTRPDDAADRRIHPGPGLADCGQAVYYAMLLVDLCAEIDSRIADDRRLFAANIAIGDLVGIRSVQRAIRAEQYERYQVEGLVMALHQRFPETRAHRLPERASALVIARPKSGIPSIATH